MMQTSIAPARTVLPFDLRTTAPPLVVTVYFTGSDGSRVAPATPARLVVGLGGSQRYCVAPKAPTMWPRAS